MLSKIDIVTKARVLLEALPYIQQFRGSIFVVKYGGSFMDDPDHEIRTRVATDIVFLSAVGIRVVVVHGGGKAISRAMHESKLNPVFRNGLRVTDSETIKIVEQTLSQKVNGDICEIIAEKKGRANGIPGHNVLTCCKLTEDESGNPTDLGYVGKIQSANTKLITEALSDGLIPVISPIASDEAGNRYNTNADTAASFVASSLGARRLVYLCDVPGLLRDQEDAESLISTLRVDEVEDLTRSKIISKGMLPKVNSAVRAIQSGVHRVHFVDGRLPHSLLLEIFTHRGIGTEIVHE